MSSLSDLLSKLDIKLGQQEVSNKQSSFDEQPEEALEGDQSTKPTRPRSPFVLLMTEGDDEFNFNRNHANNESFDEPSKQSDDELLILNSFTDDSLLDDPPVSPPIEESFPEVAEARLCEEQRKQPLTRQQFELMFDESGRLVSEHELRKSIFKGGVREDIRKDVWIFLFELYPFNTTLREREILSVENTVRYEAMKIRWKTLLKGIVNDYEGVSYCPSWYKGCSKNIDGNANKNVTQINFTNVTAPDLRRKRGKKMSRGVHVKEDKSNSVKKINGHAFVENENSNDSVNSSLVKCDNNIKEENHRNENNVTSVTNLNLERLENDGTDNKNTENLGVNVNCENGEQLDVSAEIAEAMCEENQAHNICEKSPNKNHSNSNTCKSHADSDCTEEQTDSTNSCEKLEITNSILENVKTSCGSFDNIEREEPSPRTINSFDYVDGTFVEECACVGECICYTSSSLHELVDNKDMFNLDKSLYSKSEKFKSIDINKLPSQVSNSTETLTDKTDICNNNKNELSLPLQNVKIHNVDVDVALPIRKSSSSKELTSYEYETSSPRYLYPSDSPIDNKMSRSLEGINFTEPFPPVPENRICAKSPTGETLDSLPPWIAQMIKASTSPHVSPRNRTKSDSSPSKNKTPNNSVTSCVSPLNSDLIQDKALLGIVENANKYLLKYAENSTSSAPSTPTVSAVEKVPLKPKYSTPPSILHHSRNSFFADSPKLRLVAGADQVDSTLKNTLVRRDKCPYCNFDQNKPPKIVLPSSNTLGEDQLKFMEIQAQVFAARQPYSEKTIFPSVRVIDKDVPRTDRELDLFKGDSNPGLVKLRDSLLTYSFFHPEVGYAQGMNDIMSRFLVVMDTEAEAYWLFVNYMEHFKNDFMEEGMLRKVGLLEQLLMKMDRELYDVLQSTDVGLIFCHRWLLLNFKREFEYKEALRLFEITSSRHLEVSSLEAEKERSKERAKEFENDNAGSHLEEIYMSPEYPYDIFVCLAMLTDCRDIIMASTNDINQIYQILSKLPTTLDLQKVLEKSEELFYQYCRKSVVDCFQVIDELEVKNFKKPRFLFR